MDIQKLNRNLSKLNKIFIYRFWRLCRDLSRSRSIYWRKNRSRKRTNRREVPSVKRVKFDA